MHAMWITYDVKKKVLTLLRLPFIYISRERYTLARDILLVVRSELDGFAIPALDSATKYGGGGVLGVLCR